MRYNKLVVFCNKCSASIIYFHFFPLTLFRRLKRESLQDAGKIEVNQLTAKKNSNIINGK